MEILLLIFAAILQAESEFIKYRPWNCLFPKAPWYVENIWDYTSKGKFIDWLMRYPLSFAKDGFHLVKSLEVLTIIALLLIGPTIKLSGNFIVDAIIYYVIYGIAFNIWYHKWYELIFKKRN